MQTRTRSLIEQLANTGSGFLLSLLTWEYVVKPIWEIQTSFVENLNITRLFTAVSIARSYIWRRLFNRLDNKNKKKRSHEPDCDHGPAARR